MKGNAPKFSKTGSQVRVTKNSASLFAPGYSIAAVIANEFTEATGDLYVQALIELGLVLFIVTFMINGLARLLILATTARGSEHP